LYEKGEKIEDYEVLSEMPYEPQSFTKEEWKTKLKEAGNEFNIPLVEKLADLFDYNVDGSKKEPEPQPEPEPTPEPVQQPIYDLSIFGEDEEEPVKKISSPSTKNRVLGMSGDFFGGDTSNYGKEEEVYNPSFQGVSGDFFGGDTTNLSGLSSTDTKPAVFGNFNSQPQTSTAPRSSSSRAKKLKSSGKLDLGGGKSASVSKDSSGRVTAGGLKFSKKASKKKFD
jgi:hypothetical protein